MCQTGMWTFSTLEDDPFWEDMKRKREPNRTKSGRAKLAILPYSPPATCAFYLLLTNKSACFMYTLEHIPVREKRKLGLDFPCQGAKNTLFRACARREQTKPRGIWELSFLCSSVLSYIEIRNELHLSTWSNVNDSEHNSAFSGTSMYRG